MTRKELHERARWAIAAASEHVERTEDEVAKELIEELARLLSVATRPGS